MPLPFDIPPLLFLLILASPLLHLGLGEKVIRLLRLLCRRHAGEIDSPPPPAAQYLLGLLSYLWLAYLLKWAGLPWPAAALLPLLAAVWPLADLRRALELLRPPLRISWLLWFAVHLVLSCSLFRAGETISTVWISNYGDLTFHLGMISSFLFGENIPPEYHLFPGVPLSYPFLINFWTSLLWWIEPELRALPLIFAAQWLTCWLILFAAVDGGRKPLIPWAILFGGGSFAAIFAAVTAQPDGPLGGVPASTLISKGYPWAPFISSIWITQRSAMLGLCIIAAAVSLFHRHLAAPAAEQHGADGVLRLSVAGLLLALAPLAHGHFFLTAVLYIGGVLVLRLLAARRAGRPAEQHREAARSLLLFAAWLLPSLLFAPLLLQKTGILSLTAGWMPWPAPDGPLESLLHASANWLKNAPAWLAVLLLLAFQRNRRLPLLALSVLFFAANSVQIAVWEFDQIKIFIVLYVVSLMLLPRTSVLAGLLLILLIVPGAIESAKVYLNRSDYTIYTAEQIERAAAIRAAVPPDAIILGAPDHNSLVTLTGRRLYYGYEGTLHSHGIAYQKRGEKHKSLETAAKCSVGDSPCADHLLWTEREQRYWERKAPGSDISAKPVVDGFLFTLQSAKQPE